MKTYARVFQGEVVEIIPPAPYPSDSPEGVEPPWMAGDDIPLDRRYTEEFCSTCVDITEVAPPPQVGWLYVGAEFSEPISV